MQYFQEDDIVYVRNKKILTDQESKEWEELEQFPYPFPSHIYIRSTSTELFKLHPFSIGFCGKIYNGFRLDEFKTKDDIKLNKFVSSYHYNGISLIKLLSKKYKTFDPRTFSSKGNLFYWKSSLSPLQFLNKPHDNEKFRNKCIDNNISIILTQEIYPNVHSSRSKDTVTIINPELRLLEFFQVFHHYIAFQELSMWIGGTLIKPDKPMVRISDKDKIHKRGFDRYSFRRLPGGKK
jgi:hypothetical protein